MPEQPFVMGNRNCTMASKPFHRQIHRKNWDFQPSTKMIHVSQSMAHAHKEDMQLKLRDCISSQNVCDITNRRDSDPAQQDV